MEKRNVGKFLSELVNLVDFNRRHRIEKKRPSPPSLIKDSSAKTRCNLFSEKNKSSYTHVRTPIETLFFTRLSDYQTTPPGVPLTADRLSPKSSEDQVSWVQISSRGTLFLLHEKPVYSTA